MVGGATPTILGGVPIRGVCGSAYLLTSGHVRNCDGVESETGRVRCPLLADWPKRDAMPMLDSTHARARLPASKVCGQCRKQRVVVVNDVKENPDYQNNSAAHEHLIPIRLGTGP